MREPITRPPVVHLDTEPVPNIDSSEINSGIINGGEFIPIDRVWVRLLPQLFKLLTGFNFSGIDRFLVITEVLNGTPLRRNPELPGLNCAIGLYFLEQLELLFLSDYFGCSPLAFSVPRDLGCSALTPVAQR